MPKIDNNLTPTSRGTASDAAAILESVTDAFFALDGEWRFSYLNAQAECLLARTRGELLGRSVWEEFPAAVGSDFERQYRRAVSEQTAVTFEAYYPPPLDTWFEVRAYPAEGGLSVYFHDITERVGRLDRERFLAELAERARGLTDPDEVIADALRSVGRFLGVARCVFVDIDIEADTCTTHPDYRTDESVVSMEGVSPISAFGQVVVAEYGAGRTVVVEDVHNDPIQVPPENIPAYDALSIRAHVGVPVVHSSRLVSCIGAHSATPRRWKPEEVELLRTVVERTWLTVEVTRQHRALVRGADEQHARAEREALVGRVGQALLATTDPAVIQGRAVTLLGEALGADRCYLSSWDASGDHIVVLQDYRRADLPSVAGEYSAPQYAPVMDVLFAQGTAVVPDVRSSGLPDNVKEMMTGFALNCVLTVPFFERGGRIAAALTVAMADAPRHWTPEEVSLAEAVAALTRTAVESARVAQREHRIAEQLQAALQPALPQAVPGLKVTRYYEAALTGEAGVGGDFYDVFAIGNDCTALVVGDLSGKGLQAAAQVSVVRNMLRAFLYSQPTLAEAVTELNRVLAENNLLEGFATLFVGAFDGGTRVLRHVNCGQEPALVRRADTGEVEELAATGPVLGSFQGAAFGERAAVLSRGDALAVFSDGLTECGPNRLSMLGVEGVSALFRQPVPDEEASELAERLVLHLITGVDAAAAGGVMRDDVCLLVAVVE